MPPSLSLPSLGRIARQHTQFVGPGTAIFQPSTLALEGLWSGNYTRPGGAQGLWTGQVSAGSSGGRNLSVASANPAPAIGTSPTNQTYPVYDGSDDFLGNGGLTIAATVGGGSYRLWSVFFVNTFKTNQANAWLNSILFGDTGQYFGLHVKGSGASGFVQAFTWDGAAKVAQAAISSQTWYLADVIYNGTTADLYLNAILSASSARGAPQNQTFTIATGSNGAVTELWDGSTLEIGVGKNVFATMTPAMLLASCRARLGRP